MRFIQFSLVGLVLVGLLLGGCARLGPGPAAADANPAGICFTLVPLEVALGEGEGTSLDDHVRATDRHGVPLTNFGYSMGVGVVLKSFPTSGLPGSGSLRAFAPRESCSHLSTDVIHVTARDARGETAQADLPVVILGASAASEDSAADAPPGASSADSSDDSPGASTDAAPVLPLQALRSSRGTPALALSAPTPGENLDGVQHLAEGRASGLAEVRLWGGAAGAAAAPGGAGLLLRVVCGAAFIAVVLAEIGLEGLSMRLLLLQAEIAASRLSGVPLARAPAAAADSPGGAAGTRFCCYPPPDLPSPPTGSSPR